MKRLGQYLIERGWITRGDLDRALAAQSAFGGTLGTCLLEFDALQEEQLLEALASQRGFRATGVDLLRSIPIDVRRTIPARLAETHRAVPVALRGGRLEVATASPWDLRCQDEFAFAASRKVTMRIALEVRVAEALERNYGVACSQRLSRILDRVNRAKYLWSENRQPVGNDWESPGNQLFPDAPAMQVPSLPELDIGPGTQAWDSVSEPAPAIAPAPPTRSPRASRRRRTKPAEPPAAPSEPARRFPAPVEETPASAPHKSQTEPSAEEPAEVAPIRKDGLADRYPRLAASKDRDEIGREILVALRQHFTRAALFAVVSDGVRGWMGAGPGFDAGRLAKFRLSFDEPSVFLNLRQGTGFHLGPLPAMPAHRDVARCWLDDTLTSCFLLPIPVRGRLAAVLYGDRAGRSLAGLDLETMRELATVAAETLERCIVLKKQTQAGAHAV